MTLPMRQIVTGIALAALSGTLWFMPVPDGASPEMMKAAALVVLAVGSWATMLLPEHLVAIAFFLGAMVLHVSSAPVIFSGFASAAFWLVFGGMVIGAGVERTGLGSRIARTLVRRFTGGYGVTVAGVITVCLALGFLMPSTVSRLVLLLPIVLALADRLGYAEGSRGRTGLVIATGFGSYLGPTAILPANVPNNVLLGAAQNFHGIQIQYFDWLIVHFPVLGLVKSVLLVGVVWWLFNDKPTEPKAAAPDAVEPSYWSRDEQRIALLLMAALALWASDAVHGISPAWISLAAGLICLLPVVGLVPPQTFRDKVPMNPLIYVAGILGMGALVADSGLGEALAHLVLDNVALDPGDPTRSFFALSLMATLLGTVSTMPGVPAILTPIADDIAVASGLPLKTVLMTFVSGYSTVVFPYQVPPLIVLLQMGGIPASAAVRTALVSAFFSLVVLLPMNYLWWRIIGLLP